MAGLDAVLGWLRGAQPTPSLGLEKAPPLASYPSQADADYARNYGFGDNNINEDYLNNNKADILGMKQTFKVPVDKKTSVTRELLIPESGAGKMGKTVTSPDMAMPVDLNANPKIQGNLRNVMMEAALAANRSPIAATGFDPSRVTMDTVIQNPSVGGIYRPDNDRMYVPEATHEGIVHESTHRGIQKLLEKYPEASNLMDRLPPEELVVRWLMHSKGGDPEGKAGEIDARQRQQGINAFNSTLWPSVTKENQEALRQLEELAIKDRLTRSRRSGPQ